MAEYASFHNANKYSPSAKYLIYHCALSDSQKCNGLGDRLRGIMFMTRIAHGTRRILLINNTQPVDFTYGFAPTAFDWRVGNISTPCSDITASCPDAGGRELSSMYWNSDGGWWTPDELVDGSLLLRDADITHFYMTACTFPSAFLGPWAPFLPSWRDFGPLSPSHCLFSMLFKPSIAVEQRVKEFETQLGVHNPGREARYVAIHLRLGVDNTEEQREVHPNINASFVCARKLGQMLGVTDMAVATDSGRMRRAIREGAYPGFSAVEILAAHIHFVRHGDERALQKFVDTVAEFVLLARSACLIMSGSGFSEAALMMGGHSCWSTLDMCSWDFGDQG